MLKGQSRRIVYLLHHFGSSLDFLPLANIHSKELGSGLNIYKSEGCLFIQQILIGCGVLGTDTGIGHQ